MGGLCLLRLLKGGEDSPERAELKPSSVPLHGSNQATTPQQPSYAMGGGGRASHGTAIARWGQSPLKRGRCPASPQPGRIWEPGEAPQPLFTDWFRWSCKAVGMRKNPPGRPRVRVKTFPQAFVFPTGAQSIPRLMLFYFPSKALCFIIAPLRSPSHATLPLRGALALPPPCFAESFPVYCGGFCGKHIH